MEVDDQIRVRFVTKTESLAVPDTALSLATACGRAQLGDVVNKLRGGSDLDLDFLWDDKLVQGSLAQHAARHGLSTENVAELEYFERRPEPEHAGSVTCGDDWVGCLSGGASVLAGSYDGRLFWARDGSVAAAAHDGAVTCVASTSSTVVSGGKDAAVKAWRVSGGTLRLVSEGEHAHAVASCALHEARAFTGDWGGLVFAWNIPAEGEGEPASKRQKTDAWAPTTTTKAHAQVVAGMCLSDNELWTCSWDHAVKLWDAATLEESFGGSCNVALNCIDVNNETAATGAHDGSIVLWDARCRAAQKSLRGHSHQSVASVAWLSDGRLVSAGHDGRLCVWDVRGAATEPVSVLSCSLNKCLCVSSGDGALFAGGDAPQVHRFSCPGA